jgi:FkbM family methyltransferase
VTYAQNREDLILDGILRSVSVGFYVDVGANHPEIDSVTKLFYDKGWSGINIEPHEHLVRELCRQRPRDINIHAGVSSQPGTMQLFSHDSNDGLSTFSAELKQMYVDLGTSRHREVTVPVMTLTEILRKHRPTGDIHFLKIDVEGLELEVLLGNNWMQFRPWVLCLERGIQPARTAAINAFLSVANYFHAFHDGINDYYVANERRALWDGFSYAREIILAGVPLHASLLPLVAGGGSPSSVASLPLPVSAHRSVQVDELLALEGEEFIRAAYAAILNRAPDPGGFENYMGELRAGASKLAILKRLRRSPEGQRQRVVLKGWRRALLRHAMKLQRAPASSKRASDREIPDHDPPGTPKFHSKYGGLWIDRTDFEAQLAHRVRAGQVPERLVPVIRDFERNGFAILRQAVPEQDLIRFENIISAAFRNGHPALLVQEPGQTETRPPKAGMNRRAMRIVDCYAVIPEALDVFCAPALVELLRVLLDERPKLFQSLSFDMGSEQGFHQDTAYVVVDKPLELIGCWIALEDVRPGSGELQYLVGSHRLPDFDFGSGKKHRDEAADPSGHLHLTWAQWLVEESARRGYTRASFFAKRGDILVWHADLAHGGAPVTDPNSTRKSLVGHFCPESVLPAYAHAIPQRATTRVHRDISYCSWHYDLTSSSGARLGGAAR